MDDQELGNDWATVAQAEPVLIDASRLAELMLDWEKMQRKADWYAKVIQQQVLLRGETVVTGNVKATYNSPRKTYHYEQGAGEWGATETDIAEYTTTKTVTSTDWRGLVLKGLEIKPEDVPYTEGKPSVSLKILAGDQ